MDSDFLTIKIFSDGCQPNAPEGHANFFQALMEKIFFRIPEGHRVLLADLKGKYKRKLVTSKSLESILQLFREDNVASFNLIPELMRSGPTFSLYSHLNYEQQYGEDGKFDSYDFSVPQRVLSLLSYSVEEFVAALLDCLGGIKILAAYADSFSNRGIEYESCHWWHPERKTGSIQFWRTHALGYYWLQILNEAQIDRLGGRERIFEVYPHSFDLKNASNGLVLKATDKLSEMTEKHYVDLYYFLKPLLADPREMALGHLLRSVWRIERTGGSSDSYYKQSKYYFNAIEDYRFATDKIARIKERGLTFANDREEIEEILGVKL